MVHGQHSPPTFTQSESFSQANTSSQAGASPSLQASNGSGAGPHCRVVNKLQRSQTEAGQRSEVDPMPQIPSAVDLTRQPWPFWTSIELQI